MPEDERRAGSDHLALAVVSTFNPGKPLVANVQVLLSECAWVVVSDDGSTTGLDVLEECGSLGATVLRPGVNGGIARALNTGVAAGLAAHPETDLILTMDQDSALEPGDVVAVSRAYDRARAAGISVGMLTPDRIAGLPRRRRRTRRGVVLSGEPLQSGLVVPVTVWRLLGPLLEDLFIDGVDSEYFLRAGDAGLAAVVASGADIVHSLGTMTTADVFGRPLAVGPRAIEVRVAASWRYYFIVRNRVRLVRSYGSRNALWSLGRVLADCRHIVLVTMLAPGRGARLAMALRGLRDGLAGVTGPGPRARARPDPQEPG